MLFFSILLACVSSKTQINDVIQAEALVKIQAKKVRHSLQACSNELLFLLALALSSAQFF